MAFKGTDKIGTTNYGDEKTALEKVEQAYQAYDQERRRATGSMALQAHRAAGIDEIRVVLRPMNGRASQSFR